MASGLGTVCHWRSDSAPDLYL